MNLRSVKPLLAETICFLLLTATAFAQSDRGTITGTVTDPGKSVVAGATVTATNKATGVKQQTVTSETGNYTISSLPAGLYEVRSRRPASRKSSRRESRSRSCRPPALTRRWKSARLSRPSLSQPKPPCSRPRTPNRAPTSAAELFNSLPLNFGATNSIRSWLSFIQLAPGVSGPINEPNGEHQRRAGWFLQNLPRRPGCHQHQRHGVDQHGRRRLGRDHRRVLDPDEQLRGRVRPGARRRVQLHNQVGHERVPRQRIRVPDQRGVQCAPLLLDSVRLSPRAPKALDRKHDYGFTVGGPCVCPGSTTDVTRHFFFFNLEKYRNVTRSSGTPARPCRRRLIGRATSAPR